jgi:ubiquitin-protein ligase
MAAQEGNAARKRLLADLREIRRAPLRNVSALPLDDDLFTWHCNLAGPSDSPYEGGIFHIEVGLALELALGSCSLACCRFSNFFSLIVLQRTFSLRFISPTPTRPHPHTHTPTHTNKHHQLKFPTSYPHQSPSATIFSPVNGLPHPHIHGNR